VGTTCTLWAVRADTGAGRRAAGRGLVLLPAGAFAVHQLRYWLTYGSQTSTQLADQGHAYMGSVVPWIVLATAAALGSFLVRAALAWRGRGAAVRSRPLVAVWATTSLALVVIYSFQETLEGILEQGHPGGFTGVFGHGGWWSVPVALAIGLIIALLLRVADSVVAAVARRRVAVRRTATAPVLGPGAASPIRMRPLAGAAAGRAPPTLAFSGSN